MSDVTERLEVFNGDDGIRNRSATKLKNAFVTALKADGKSQREYYTQ